MFNNKVDNVDNKKVLVVFSGYNQRAVIAFLRTLAKNQNRSMDWAIPRNQENFSLQQKIKRYRRRKVCARLHTAAADASIWTCHTQNSFR